MASGTTSGVFQGFLGGGPYVVYASYSLASQSWVPSPGVFGSTSSNITLASVPYCSRLGQHLAEPSCAYGCALIAIAFDYSDLADR